MVIEDKLGIGTYFKVVVKDKNGNIKDETDYTHNAITKNFLNSMIWLPYHRLWDGTVNDTSTFKLHGDLDIGMDMPDAHSGCFTALVIGNGTATPSINDYKLSGNNILQINASVSSGLLKYDEAGTDDIPANHIRLSMDYLYSYQVATNYSFSEIGFINVSNYENQSSYTSQEIKTEIKPSEKLQTSALTLRGLLRKNGNPYTVSVEKYDTVEIHTTYMMYVNIGDKTGEFNVNINGENKTFTYKSCFMPLSIFNEKYNLTSDNKLNVLSKIDSRFTRIMFIPSPENLNQINANYNLDTFINNVKNYFGVDPYTERDTTKLTPRYSKNAKDFLKVNTIELPRYNEGNYFGNDINKPVSWDKNLSEMSYTKELLIGPYAYLDFFESDAENAQVVGIRGFIITWYVNQEGNSHIYNRLFAIKEKSSGLPLRKNDKQNMRISIKKSISAWGS